MRLLMKNMMCLLVGASAIVLSSMPAFAQQPRITNAKIQAVSAGEGLEKVVQRVMKSQNAPAWIAYSIPTTGKDRTMCCFDSVDQIRANGCCSGCRLEREGSFLSGTGNNGSDCGPLEDAHTAFVFARIEQQRITKVRTFSPGCAVDASGMPLFWVSGVKPAESVELLAQIASSSSVDDGYKKSVAQHAIAAIAIHDDAAADRALEKFIAQGQPDRLREQTALWLGTERGKRGLEILRAAVKGDPSERFRERALIGFAQSQEPDALKDLIRMGREDSSTRVRGQAIFWLAQAGGKKEAEHITDAIENDPETEVKKKAVFALTQIPHDEGIPMLIQVAKTNKNAVVRKQAIFWLGQSHDSRALDYLEQILTK